MKKAMRFMSVLLMASMLLCGCVQTSDNPGPSDTPDTPAATDAPQPSPASDFEYEISKDKNKIYITKYIGSSDTVVIPSSIDNLPVISLKGTINEDGVSTGVFENCNIKTVVIPETITAIGYRSFKECRELAHVTICSNSKLQVISSEAFANCISIERLNLSSTTVSIVDSHAFDGCTNLQEIILPDSLLEINQQAFYQCSSLSEINLPTNVVKIGPEAFGYCTKLRRITIPAGLELMAIDSARFHHNSSLEQIIFSEGREEITGYAFFGISSNVEIIIPKSVKKLSLEPFVVSDSMSIKITFLGDCPELVAKNDFLGNLTICYDPNTVGWDSCDWKNNYNVEIIG